MSILKWPFPTHTCARANTVASSGYNQTKRSTPVLIRITAQLNVVGFTINVDLSVIYGWRLQTKSVLPKSGLMMMMMIDVLRPQINRKEINTETSIDTVWLHSDWLCFNYILQINQKGRLIKGRYVFLLAVNRFVK